MSDNGSGRAENKKCKYIRRDSMENVHRRGGFGERGGTWLLSPGSVVRPLRSRTSQGLPDAETIVGADQRNGR